jgi:hypothetical protein
MAGQGKAASPVLCDYRVWVEHTVTFSLHDNPGDVVRTTGGDWARLTGVTVHLYNDREPRIWAGGRRCRKDGNPDRRMGNIGTSVELPDPDVWIERARQAITEQANTDCPVQP